MSTEYILLGLCTDETLSLETCQNGKTEHEKIIPDNTSSQTLAKGDQQHESDISSAPVQSREPGKCVQ